MRSLEKKLSLKIFFTVLPLNPRRGLVKLFLRSVLFLLLARFYFLSFGQRRLSPACPLTGRKDGMRSEVKIDPYNALIN